MQLLGLRLIMDRVNKTRSTIGSDILFNPFFDNFEQKGTILQKKQAVSVENRGNILNVLQRNDK